MNNEERAARLASELVEIISGLDEVDESVSLLNKVRGMLHDVSPFRGEPVDHVQWVRAASVVANDYNPNAVAPPEMELLRLSIMEDGFTQPIVGWPRGDVVEVIDGFHRNRVGKECNDVLMRIHGYLPISAINTECENRSARMASTIRHNRARGKHKVTAMSEIVVELKNRNWANKRIARELGMDDDEVLRLCQITGLQDLFSDQEFSKSWDVEGEVTEEDFVALTDDPVTMTEGEVRTVNTSDENRIFHTYDKWECYKAGLYKTGLEGVTKDDGMEMYRDFLSDSDRFSAALECIITEWKKSCEHYLTNSAMNRIAWLGQAAVCYAEGVPAVYRSGFFLLSDEEQNTANNVALVYLNRWLSKHGLDEVTLEVAYSGRQSDIY